MILGFTQRMPTQEDMIVAKETEEMVLFEPFLLVNPSTPNCFPLDDEPYYSSLEYQLRHLLYKFSKGWITSERQVIYTSDECISTIHFVFGENKEVSKVNVFQRSANILNLNDDAQFLNYFINKYCADPKTVELAIFVSQPHLLKGKKKKVED